MATASVNIQPQLLAFIICESIVIDNGMAILWRVIDTFNYDVKLPDTLSQEDQEKFNVRLQCELYTRWGPPGKGDFEEQLRLITPDGKEVHNPEPRGFKMSGEHGFHQTIWNIQLGVHTPGTYSWALYLNGAEIARLPFKVNITRQPVQTK